MICMAQRGHARCQGQGRGNIRVLSSVTNSFPSSLLLAGSLMSEDYGENEGDSHNPRAIPLTPDLHSAL